jgi:hypothetical protein
MLNWASDLVFESVRFEPIAETSSSLLCMSQCSFRSRNPSFCDPALLVDSSHRVGSDLRPSVCASFDWWPIAVDELERYYFRGQPGVLRGICSKIFLGGILTLIAVPIIGDCGLEPSRCSIKAVLVLTWTLFRAGRAGNCSGWDWSCKSFQIVSIQPP